MGVRRDDLLHLESKETQMLALSNYCRRLKDFAGSRNLSSSQKRNETIPDRKFMHEDVKRPIVSLILDLSGTTM